MCQRLYYVFVIGLYTQYRGKWEKTREMELAVPFLPLSV